MTSALVIRLPQPSVIGGAHFTRTFGRLLPVQSSDFTSYDLLMYALVNYLRYILPENLKAVVLSCHLSTFRFIVF